MLQLTFQCYSILSGLSDVQPYPDMPYAETSLLTTGDCQKVGHVFEPGSSCATWKSGCNVSCHDAMATTGIWLRRHIQCLGIGGCIPLSSHCYSTARMGAHMDIVVTIGKVMICVQLPKRMREVEHGTYRNVWFRHLLEEVLACWRVQYFANRNCQR
jgi:hypothetical protein